MSQPIYRVGYSAKILQQFRRAMDRAELTGQLDEAVAAAKELMAMLEQTPYDLGESREQFHDAGIEIRVAFISAFVVYFGIHEDSKNVFIRSIFWNE